MATGYVVSGRGDLDVLFKPRTSAAAANTGFMTPGSVDLAQRFEPRGATTAIAATNFKSGATDLAQIFMDFNAATGPTYTNDFSNFVAGQSGTGNRYRGFVSAARAGTPPAMGSFTDLILGAYTIGQLYWDITAGEMVFSLHSSGGTPPDTDLTFWQVQIDGTFEGTGMTTWASLRQDRTSTNTGNQGGLLWRDWRFAGGVFNPVMTSGSTYLYSSTRQNP